MKMYLLEYLNIKEYWLSSLSRKPNNYIKRKIDRITEPPLALGNIFHKSLWHHPHHLANGLF